ncbi:hypothetical protein AX15_002572 [Amanita polypyramis BW_CC]|nr:hypothetical protein AX15_002572 [Amanita polypyramis BW_CC]
MPATWRLPDGPPLLTLATLTGILFAISGNILISFALNLQKLAHKRLIWSSTHGRRNVPQNPSPTAPSSDPQGMNTNDHHYGALPIAISSRTLPSDPAVRPEEAALLDIPRPAESETKEDWNESRYLKSKMWWLGFLLMNIGEAGNFISYAYAPASVVAPLGTFALISNCIFAPCLLGEQFKKRDLIGILIATTGAVTVVLASNSSETKMDPDTLRRAVTQLPFIIYSSIYAAAALVLATLSHGKIGQRWVFVDVGLCALFGGFTVLATKALSTLLTTEWINIFTEWITYPVLFVLVATGVGQIRYLNRALMKFDSKVVIPTQFVLFSLSAILGSAILYGDFKTATFYQIVAFIYGVTTTFAGVFIIAWSPNHHPEDEETLDDPDASHIANSTDSHHSLSRARSMPAVHGYRDIPSSQNKRNRLGMIGLSPAKHLLLVDSCLSERWNDIASEFDVDGPCERRPHASNSFTQCLRKSTSVPGTGGNSLTGRYVGSDSDTAELALV